MSNELGRVEDVVTVGIKHTSNFARRRVMLNMLLRSVRQNHGPSLAILVADDGGSPDLTALTSFGAQHIALPAASGLSHGRNAIVLATRTPFLALMDDDVLFHGATSLLTLLEALRGSPKTALAGGCYHDMRFDKRDCFNLRFDVDDGGAVVHAKKAHGLTDSGCYPVDVRALLNICRHACARCPLPLRTPRLRSTAAGNPQLLPRPHGCAEALWLGSAPAGDGARVVLLPTLLEPAARTGVSGRGRPAQHLTRRRVP